MFNLKRILKDSAISFSIALGLIAFAEGVFRFANFTKFVISKTNSDKKLIYENKYIAFDKKLSIKEIKSRQGEVGDRLMYKPWIQIGNYDHKDRFSTVINGSRIVKDSELSKECINAKTIWMFGGSTTYGVGVPDSENIPSFLQQIINKNHNCIRIVNYGVPFHYSKQETIYFVNNLIESKETPFMAIFLDGLNDFAQPGSSIRGEPYYSSLLTSFFGKSNNPGRANESKYPISLNLEIVKYFQTKFVTSSSSSSSYKNSDMPNPYTEISGAEKIANKLLDNTSKLGKICKAYGVSCFRFLQPVAAVDYTPPSSFKDVLTNWVIKEEGRASRFRYGYKLIRSSNLLNFDGIYFFDISGLFKSYSGIPYVDGGHYSPRANNLIAESIYSLISQTIIKSR